MARKEGELSWGVPHGVTRGSKFSRFLLISIGLSVTNVHEWVPRIDEIKTKKVTEIFSLNSLCFKIV